MPEISPIPAAPRQSGEKTPEISPTPARHPQSGEKMPEISPSPAAPRHFGETFRRILLIPAAFYGDSAPFYYPKRNRRAHLVEEDARCVRFRPFLLTPGHNYCQVCTPKHPEAGHRDARSWESSGGTPGLAPEGRQVASAPLSPTLCPRTAPRSTRAEPRLLCPRPAIREISLRSTGRLRADYIYSTDLPRQGVSEAGGVGA